MSRHHQSNHSRSKREIPDLFDEINNVIDDEIKDFFEGDIILQRKRSSGNTATVLYFHPNFQPGQMTLSMGS